MAERLESIVNATAHAVEVLAAYAAQVRVEWLLAGLALHYVAQAVRTRAWWNIIRASHPEADAFRARDAVAAYLAGAGLNAVIPARGGDVLKLCLVHRRIPHARYATLAATLVPETLFETACGAGLVAWALAHGFLPVPDTRGDVPTVDVSLLMAHPIVSAAAAAAITAAAALLVRRLRRRAGDVLARLRRGLAILSRPRHFATGVVSWQALSRLIRLASIACLLAAFRLPVTPATVLLVMAAQGGGRIIPIAPVSAGLRLAMLAYGFVEVTGTPVDIGRITTFTAGTSVALLACGLAISAVIIERTFGTPSPRRALAAARAVIAAQGEAHAEPAPAPGTRRGVPRLGSAAAQRISTGVPTGTRG
jgi:hypothetical protein